MTNGNQATKTWTLPFDEKQRAFVAPIIKEMAKKHELGAIFAQVFPDGMVIRITSAAEAQEIAQVFKAEPFTARTAFGKREPLNQTTEDAKK